MIINNIQDKINKGQYRFSDHAIKRMIDKSIDRYDVEEAIVGGEIIEDYPDDKYTPMSPIQRSGSMERSGGEAR